MFEAQQRADYATQVERREERETFLAAIQGMTAVSTEASKANQAQATALKSFLDSFAVTSPPQRREWDEEADDKRYIEKHLPAELKGLNQIEQFQMLLDRIDNGD